MSQKPKSLLALLGRFVHASPAVEELKPAKKPLYIYIPLLTCFVLSFFSSEEMDTYCTVRAERVYKLYEVVIFQVYTVYEAVIFLCIMLDYVPQGQPASRKEERPSVTEG